MQETINAMIPMNNHKLYSPYGQLDKLTRFKYILRALKILNYHIRKRANKVLQKIFQRCLHCFQVEDEGNFSVGDLILTDDVNSGLKRAR